MKINPIKQLIGVYIFFIILFITAGRLNYWQGWVYAGIDFIIFLISTTFLRIDTELLKEISKTGEAKKLLYLVAQKQNKFFAGTVRIQTERGHTVCESGVYKYIRHPAYLGILIHFIGFLLLLSQLLTRTVALINLSLPAPTCEASSGVFAFCSSFLESL